MFQDLELKIPDIFKNTIHNNANRLITINEKVIIVFDFKLLKEVIEYQLVEHHDVIHIISTLECADEDIFQVNQVVNDLVDMCIKGYRINVFIRINKL